MNYYEEISFFAKLTNIDAFEEKSDMESNKLENIHFKYSNKCKNNIKRGFFQLWENILVVSLTKIAFFKRNNHLFLIGVFIELWNAYEFFSLRWMRVTSENWRSTWQFDEFVCWLDSVDIPLVIYGVWMNNSVSVDTFFIVGLLYGNEK